MGGIVDSIFGGGGDDAAEASKDAAQIQAQYQQQALDYLKEREKMPQQFRESALQQLGGLAGLPGGVGSQQEMIDRALASPLYGAMMGGREAGEEAILRSAAATGGLRSGNVQEALYDYNTRLQNQALLESYNQQLGGLQGLAGLPSLAPMIAQQTGGIGETLAMGQVGAGQAQQAQQQQGFGNIMGLGQLGLQAYGMFSDRRLKKDIKHIGKEKGFNIYSWSWNTVGNKMGLTGKTVGCMADEIYPERPDAVIIKDCFLFVIYGKLGIFAGG